MYEELKQEDLKFQMLTKEPETTAKEDKTENSRPIKTDLGDEGMVIFITLALLILIAYALYGKITEKPVPPLNEAEAAVNYRPEGCSGLTKLGCDHYLEGILYKKVADHGTLKYLEKKDSTWIVELENENTDYGDDFVIHVKQNDMDFKTEDRLLETEKGDRIFFTGIYHKYNLWDEQVIANATVRFER